MWPIKDIVALILFWQNSDESPPPRQNNVCPAGDLSALCDGLIFILIIQTRDIQSKILKVLFMLLAFQQPNNKISRVSATVLSKNFDILRFYSTLSCSRSWWEKFKVLVFHLSIANNFVAATSRESLQILHYLFVWTQGRSSFVGPWRL